MNADAVTIAAGALMSVHQEPSPSLEHLRQRLALYRADPARQLEAEDTEEAIALLTGKYA